MTAVIFDLDGTLIESAPAIRDIINELMVEIGLPSLDLKETIGYIGHGIPHLLEQTLTARGANDEREFPARLDRLHALYGAAPPGANDPFPGATEALQDLHEAGFRLGICTNKAANATINVIEAMGWDKLIGSVIAGDTLPQRKPDPTPLLEAVARLDQTTAIYVGDSEVDAATAAAAKIPFVLFTEGYRKAPVEQLEHAATFSDFGELTTIIDRIAASVHGTRSSVA